MPPAGQIEHLRGRRLLVHAVGVRLEQPPQLDELLLRERRFAEQGAPCHSAQAQKPANHLPETVQAPPVTGP
jgi:hypothetical protein